MSNGTKWAIALGGLVIVLFSGPFSGLLGVVWLVTVLVMVVSTPPKHVAPLIIESTANTDSSTEFFTQLDAAIENEQNTDTREGLVRAQSIAQHVFRSAHTEQSVQSPVQQMPGGIPLKDTKPAQQLDQTVALLYIGAFLFLGGMGLFIAYGGLSDIIRLVLIATLAAVLYVSGLLLFQKKTSLRPAAVTFLAIGLILIPLVGYASVKLTTVDVHVAWFVTSVVGLGAYVYALLRTRLELVGYLVFLMWVSLAESSLGFFNTSFIWAIWAALVIGAFSLLFIPRLSAYDRKLGNSFWWSSIVLAPIALVVSFVYAVGGGLELWQFGVSAVLSGIYSLACLRVSEYAVDSSFSKSDYAIAAHALIMLGVLTIAYDNIESAVGFTAILLLAAIVHVLLWLSLNARIAWRSYERFLYLSGPFLSVVAWYFSMTDATWLAVSVAVTAFISTCLAAVQLRLSSLLIAIGSVLVLPLTLVNAMEVYGDDRTSMLASMYAVVFFVFAAVRYLGRSNSVISSVLPIAYSAALAAAWLAAMFTGEYLIQLLMTTLLLIAIVQASFAERRPEAFALVGPSFYVLSYLIVHHYLSPETPTEHFVYAGLITATITYGISHIVDSTRARYMLFSAVSSLAVAWCTVLTLSGLPWTIVGPSILLLIAGLTLYEKERLGGKSYFLLLPISLVFVALSEYIVRADLTENWLVYTHLWSVYALIVTYYLKRNQASKSNLDTAKFMTLALFTIPVALQALVSGDEYSLLLLCEQAALLVLGVATSRKYLTAWAAVVVTLVILYSLRSFGYLQLVIIAVSFIGYALYRLRQRQ